jgi:plastocyanin
MTVGCSGSSSSAPVTVPPNGVLVKHFAFTPSTLTVRAGSTVTWVFDDPSDPHNVDSRSKALHFSSGDPLPRGTWSFTFTRPGTYAYRCDVHTWMHGTVVVTQ